MNSPNMQGTAFESWSRGKLERLPGCPACGSESIGLSLSRKDDSGLMPDVWHMHQCGQCKSIYLNPRPNSESLPAAYLDYLTHKMPDVEKVFTGNSWTWSAVRDYLLSRFGLQTNLPTLKGGRFLFQAFEPWKLKLDRFGRHLTRSRFRKPGRLLDIGCGAGEFIELAGKMGWSVSGCDPDSNVVAMCQSRGLDVRLGDAGSFSDEGGGFDVITMNQVIEHVIDPISLLEQCLKLLRPGGMLWVGFPNAQSIGFKQFGSAWAGLHPPYHLCLPTQQIMRRWLADVGFVRIQFERRGAHSKANWRNSADIAKVLGMRPIAGMSKWFGRLSGDLVSTVMTKFGEETVAIAWKAS